MPDVAPPPDLHPGTRDRVAAWAADPEVEGVLWVGSRSRGLGDAGSDDDLEVYLAPAAFSRVAPSDTYVMAPDPEASPPRLIYDAQLTTLAVLAAKAASPRDLDHWPYERARVLVDGDGRLAALVAAAAAMAPAFRRARIQHAALDAVAAATRARKTAARGHGAAARLLVARGARALARVLFALEGRWAPLDHWLEPELATLADPQGAAPRLLAALLEGRPEPLLEALTALEGPLAAEGFPPPPGRAAFFADLMHPSRAAERALHGDA